MKVGGIINNIPLALVLTILLGLLSFIVLTNCLLNDITPYDKVRNSKELVVDRDSVSYTITQKSMVYNVPCVQREDRTKAPLFLNVFPGTLNWVLFHSTALSLALASLPFLIALLIRLQTRFQLKLWHKKSLWLIIPIALIAAISIYFKNNVTNDIPAVFGARIMEHFEIVFNDPRKIIVNTVERWFLIIGIIPLLGILTINSAVNKFFTNKSEYGFSLKEGYKSLKDGLNLFALFAGLLVAVSIIGTGLQKKMILEQLMYAEEIYPDEFIFAYGLLFTFLLALFFLPSLAYLKYHKKREAIILGENNASWWNIGQESVDDIKLIFSIIIPLLSTMLQSYL